MRQSDAHAWVEVWLDGNGWVRIDPTAAVAPGRTGSIDRLRPTPGPVAAALDAIAPRFAVVNLRLMWEALNNRWNQWVLNYTQSRQLDLLRSLGFQSPSWQHLGYLLAGTVTLASLLGAAVSLWQRRRVDPWLALLAEARTALARRGVAVSAQATPRELAQAARQRWGSAAQALCDWLMRLEALRYAGSASPSSAGIATLRREWKQLQREIPGVPSRRPMAQGQT